MESYALIVCLLGLGTAVTAVVGWLLWSKTGSAAFPVGMAAFYFWTFHGGWAISAACETGNASDRMARLFNRLITPSLDEWYAWSLVLYTVFVASVGAAAYVTVTITAESSRRDRARVTVAHARVAVVCGAVGLASVACAWDLIVTAVRYGIPPYLLANQAYDHNVLLVLHQLLARGALVAGSLGLATWAGGTDGRYLAGPAGRLAGAGYLAVLGGMYFVCSAMGNKNELFQSLVTGVVFYLGNSRRPRYAVLAGLAVTCFALIAYIDTIRGRGLTDMVETLTLSELAGSALGIFETNEQFAAHLSMYGAVAYDVAPTYGSSLVSLALAVVPRAIWPSRPPDIYDYYAASVHAVDSQGFTLHHATGWYLNFGTAGVVIGGCLFGWLWGLCFNRLHAQRHDRSRLSELGASIFFFTLTGGIPLIVRAGPEAYKPVVLVCVLMPLAVLLLARPGIVRPSEAEAPAAPSRPALGSRPRVFSRR